MENVSPQVAFYHLKKNEKITSIAIMYIQMLYNCIELIAFLCSPSLPTAVK